MTYCTLTLTVYWPGKHQECGKHWTSDLMDLTLLQDLNLEEKCLFSGLGQPQASPRAAGNGSRNLLDLSIWSGTEDICSNSPLSMLLLSVSALDQPVGKSSLMFLLPVLKFVSQRCSSGCHLHEALKFLYCLCQNPNFCVEAGMKKSISLTANSHQRFLHIYITTAPTGGQPCFALTHSSFLWQCVKK